MSWFYINESSGKWQAQDVMNITHRIITGQTSPNSWILHDVNLGNNPESHELRTLYISRNVSFLISTSVGKLGFWGFWLAENFAVDIVE